MSTLQTIPPTLPAEVEANASPSRPLDSANPAEGEAGGTDSLLFAVALAQYLPAQTLPPRDAATQAPVEANAERLPAAERGNTEFLQLLSRANTPPPESRQPEQPVPPQQPVQQPSLQATEFAKGPAAPNSPTGPQSPEPPREALPVVRAPSEAPPAPIATSNRAAVTERPESPLPLEAARPINAPANSPSAESTALKSIAPESTERPVRSTDFGTDAQSQARVPQTTTGESGPEPLRGRSAQRRVSGGATARPTEASVTGPEQVHTEASTREAENRTIPRLEPRADAFADQNRAPLEAAVKPIADLPPPPLPQPLTPVATPTPEAPSPSTEPAPVAGTSRLSSPGTAGLQAQIEALSNSGGGTARVRLNPPHLGEVDIQVRMRGERVEVQIQTEEVAARSALLDAGPALLDTLASKSLRVEQFDVTLRNPANDPWGNRGAGTDPREGGGRRDQAEPGARTSSGRSEAQLIERPGPWQEPARIDSPGGIDLRV